MAPHAGLVNELHVEAGEDVPAGEARHVGGLALPAAGAAAAAAAAAAADAIAI